MSVAWKSVAGRIVLALLASLLLVAACTRRPEALPACDADRERAGDAYCGLANPEDLALLPGGAWLVVSEMTLAEPAEESGSTTRRGGDLLGLRLADGERVRLFPTDAEPFEEPVIVAPGWGDPSCPGPPDDDRFAPHGIDVGHVRERPALAVVNHGGREAVELFEIRFARGPLLEWRGCVPMPAGLMMNDVAFGASGGLVVTNFTPDLEEGGLSALWTGLEIMMGRATGSVLRWTPESGVVEIERSRGSAPNGVVVSPDGSEIFVAEWGARSLYRLRLGGEGPPRRDAVGLDYRPDNLTWTRDGRILVAGQDAGLPEILGCSETRAGGCGLDYGVSVVDPVALEATRLFAGRGAASVALEAGDEILVGVFAGDAIERLPRPE